MLRALEPSGARSLTFAPCFSSSSVVSMCALRTAKSSGVKPPIDFSFRSAPASISTAAAAVLPSAAAHISAV
jgi:hypothetical protein